jgi:hypothetical protein
MLDFNNLVIIFWIWLLFFFKIHITSGWRRDTRMILQPIQNAIQICGWSKVVKITIQLVKSYVFTSQYKLYVLNRSQNSKMGKIGSKSGKIVKIGWNRLKSRFHHHWTSLLAEDKNTMLMTGVDHLLAFTEQKRQIGWFLLTV